jgi:hypothetical protein
MPPLPAPLSLKTRVALGLGMLALAVALFSSVMCMRLVGDEEQYIGAAHFARFLTVYRDFISFQPPVYTQVLALVLDVAPSWHLLAARLLTWVLGVGCSVLLLSLLLWSGAGAGAAFAIVLAFVSSPFLAEPLLLARNDIMPVFFLLLGLALCLSGRNGFAPGNARLAAGGAALALAAATKYTYAFAAPIVAAALLYERRVAKTSKVSPPGLGAFLAGTVIGAAPVLYALASSFDNYVFSTILFHRVAPIEYWRSHGRAWELNRWHALRVLVRNLVTAGNLTLVAIGTAAFVTLAVRKARKGVAAMSRRTVLLAALLLAALAFAFLPNPSFALYFPAAAAIGALLAGELYARVAPGVAPRLLAVLLIASLLPTADHWRWRAGMVMRSLDPSRWAGVQTHRLAESVADRIAAHGVRGPVATLFPVNVLDANAVLPEFASGAWFFRSAGLYSAERVARSRGASAASLDTLFARTPPAAIVGGFDYPMYMRDVGIDQPLLDYARHNGYELVEQDLSAAGYRKGQLWVRVPKAGEHGGAGR